jgi:hypothetical protein
VPIRWNRDIDSYEFDTGHIFGTISPFGWYHGVTGLMHSGYPLNLVRPANSFLNSEYYIRPGVGRKMIPREISCGRRITHEFRDDSIIIHFPPEPECNLGMDLCYSVQDDQIDMTVHITPGVDQPGFEMFFASYVCEALKETWTPLLGEDGLVEWVKLSNRGNLNSIFGIMRDLSLLGHLPAEYPNLPVDEQYRPFSKPILIAREPTSGLALIFLCDPHATKYLAGQYHGWDTAHDWSLGADLIAGQTTRAHYRLICRICHSSEQMCESVTQLWNEFERDIRSHQTDSNNGGQPPSKEA